MIKNIKNIVVVFISIILILILTSATLYLYALPKFLSSASFLEFLKDYIAQNCGAELVVTNPVLKTHFKPYISLKIDSMILTKDGTMLLNLQNFDTDINLSKLHAKKIILQKLGADDIYADVNKLKTLSFKQKKEEKKTKSSIKIDCFNTLFYVKRCAILYKTKNNVDIKFLAKDLEVSGSREPKYLHFKVFTDLFHNNEHLRLFFKDSDNVYFKDRKLQVHNLKFNVNKSEVILNAQIAENNGFDVNLKCAKFDIENVNRFLNTNLFIPNGNQYTSSFKNLSGDFNFNIDISSQGLNGVLNVNKISAKLIPVADLPLTITKGRININPQDITMSDFNGYYGKSKNNNITLKGDVKNYSKTANTTILLKGTIYNELAKYISKISNVDISIVKSAAADLKILCDYTGKVDILGNFGFKSGSDILFGGASISPNKYFRLIDVDMSLFKDIFSINKIDYFISDSVQSNSQKLQPLVSIAGKIDIKKCVLNSIEFNVAQPLPSEFFNVLVNQQIFRRGTFSGHLKYINEKTPYLDGNMTLKDTFIVGQYTIIRNMVVVAKNDLINIVSDGRFRRANFKINANIVNKMLFPFTIKNANITVDSLDVERVMKTFGPQPKRQPNSQTNTQTQPRRQIATSSVSAKYFDVDETQKLSTETDAPITFQPNLVEIQNCLFDLKNGVYKQIKFGNLHANLTLTKQGIIEIKSNKFDFADGSSGLKVYCDLLKEKYAIKLGAKDVNADTIATSILNLKKEISGKASAILEFYTDNSAKLNGKIQFKVKDGTIAKLGMVEYLLNMASIFRNPVAMISPSTLVDIVNLPEGNFKSINGVLNIRNNSIHSMMIKSSSPQLSAFIVGRINLDDMDASLRIYTKFNQSRKGASGFLRTLSLNSLAKKATSYKKNNLTYYEAELSQLPKLETGEDTAQVFLTQFDGNIQNSNFISSLKKIK